MLDAYRDLIDELLGTPSEVRALIEAGGETEPVAEVRRAIAELRDRDRAVLERVQAITRQDSPVLKTLAMPPSSFDEELTTLLEEMDVARGDLVSLLINLSLKDWERGAIHESGGEFTLVDEIERHVEFDEAQRQQFREL